MKNIEEQEEMYFRKLMSKSRLEMPFPDFEDNVMLEIERKFVHKNAVSREIRLSWLFFITGSVFGILISLILPQMQQKILGIDPKNLAICFQIIFIVLFFTQFETLLGFLKNHRH